LTFLRCFFKFPSGIGGEGFMSSTLKIVDEIDASELVAILAVLAVVA